MRHRPRLLSDNGPAFVAGALKSYLKRYLIKHIRGAPYHPMTQGKIERFYLSMKHVVRLDNYYLPGQLKEAIAGFMTDYNEAHYPEALNNVTPADMYHGRAAEILARRAQIKVDTMRERRRTAKRSLCDIASTGIRELAIVGGHKSPSVLGSECPKSFDDGQTERINHGPSFAIR